MTKEYVDVVKGLKGNTKADADRDAWLARLQVDVDGTVNLCDRIVTVMNSFALTNSRLWLAITVLAALNMVNVGLIIWKVL